MVHFAKIVDLYILKSFPKFNRDETDSCGGVKQKERVILWPTRILAVCMYSGGKKGKKERCPSFILMPYTCSVTPSDLFNVVAANHM